MSQTMPQNGLRIRCADLLCPLFSPDKYPWKSKKTLKRIVRCQWGRHLLTGRYKCFQIASFKRCWLRKHWSNWKSHRFCAWTFRWRTCHPTTADIFWFERWLRAGAFLRFCICQLFVSSNEPLRPYSLTVAASKTHMPQIPHTCRVQTAVGCQNLKPIINRKFSAGAQSVVDRTVSAKCKLPQCICRMCMYSCKVASISNSVD